MSKRDLGNLALHFFVALILAALILFNHWFIVLATFIYAWLRAQAQHRYEFNHAEAQYARSGAGKLYLIKKSTFFGWMTWWRMFEVACWTFGAFVACLVYEIWSRLG